MKKWIIIGCLIILVSCSLKTHIEGNWSSYDTSMNNYEYMLIKKNKVFDRPATPNTPNPPTGKIIIGKYQLEDSTIIINWHNRASWKGKFINDTLLILDGRIYTKGH